MKYIAIRVDPDIRRRLKTVAAHRDRTLQDQANEALAEWLAEQERREPVSAKAS